MSFLFCALMCVSTGLVCANVFDVCRYSVYRRVTDYYNDGSDAFDMRKPLKRDKQRKTVRANGETIKVDPGEVW